MKITRRQLKQIIKEELTQVLSEQGGIVPTLVEPFVTSSLGPGALTSPAMERAAAERLLSGPTLYGPGPPAAAARPYVPGSTVVERPPTGGWDQPHRRPQSTGPRPAPPTTRPPALGDFRGMQGGTGTAARGGGAARALGTAGRGALTVGRGALRMAGGPLGVAAAVAPVVAGQLAPGSYSTAGDQYYVDTAPITTDTPQDPGTRTNIGRRAADPAPVHTATGVGMMEPHERAGVQRARRQQEKDEEVRRRQSDSERYQMSISEQHVVPRRESTQQKLQRIVSEELAKILNEEPITTDSPQQDPRHFSQQVRGQADRLSGGRLGAEEPDTSYETGAAPPRTVRRASMMEPEERAAVAAARPAPRSEQPRATRSPGTGAGHLEPGPRAAVSAVRRQGQ